MFLYMIIYIYIIYTYLVSFDIIGCRVSFRFDFRFVFLILIKFSEDRFVSFPEVSNGGYAMKARKVHHERERGGERDRKRELERRV
jgi:hypothetical protein